MEIKEDIGFEDAYKLTIMNVKPLGREIVPISSLLGRIIAENLYAKIDSPVEDSSAKDGYAVIASDVRQASAKAPRRLKLIGGMVAGECKHLHVTQGSAIRVTAGALLPKRAEAVVSQEFAEEHSGWVEIFADAYPGRNVLRKGGDVRAGSMLLEKGRNLRPNVVGLIAASGHTHAWVYKKPRIAVIATGSEVLAPGQRLRPGKIFASNLVNIYCWLTSLEMMVTTEVARDDPVAITAAIKKHLDYSDTIVTSGGAGKSERDIVIDVFDKIGWRKIYHRVRMGPGKAIGFGSLDSKPIFCLPGGPPSNEMAFLQLALPGIWKLAGATCSLFPEIKATLAATVKGQIDWTQFIHGKLISEHGRLYIKPVRLEPRLQGMADTTCIFCIPEGSEMINKGEMINAQLLSTDDLHYL